MIIITPHDGPLLVTVRRWVGNRDIIVKREIVTRSGCLDISLAASETMTVENLASKQTVEEQPFNYEGEDGA